MEKEFIPYDLALELKELGFDEKCLSYSTSNTDASGRTWTSVIVAPLYQQAFRWFREKYNLFCEIQIDRTTDPKFFFDIYQYEHFGNYKEIRIGEWYLYRTYEEAELACLEKLIEIVKK